MDKRNFSNLGDEIRDIVQNAVNTMDFQQLNRDIGNTVKGALDEVRNAIGVGYNNNRYHWKNPEEPGNGYRQNHRDKEERKYQENQRNRGHRYDGSYDREDNGGRSEQSKAYTRSDTSNQGNVSVKNKKGIFPCVPVGKVSAILFTVFGIIGMSLFGVGAFVLALLGQLTGRLNFFGTIALGLLPFFCICGLMAARGSSIRKRLQRFRRYIGLFQGRPYCSIKELSEALGLTRKYVLKDLRRMISIGMFPEGHIDEAGTCLMLNQESYNQYLELQKNIRMRSFVEGEKVSYEEPKKAEKPLGNGDEKDTEVRRAIAAGQSCIRQIKEANDAIPGEEISRKLYRLEEVISKIFSYIEKHLEQLTDIQKFMDYYLPTTLKLVNAYKEFDKLSVQGENISVAKKEIEETLDIINLAFENLLDSLYADITMDVSSDISVLETLLAQEGLTRKDFISK